MGRKKKQEQQEGEEGVDVGGNCDVKKDKYGFGTYVAPQPKKAPIEKIPPKQTGESTNLETKSTAGRGRGRGRPPKQDKQVQDIEPENFQNSRGGYRGFERGGRGGYYQNGRTQTPQSQGIQRQFNENSKPKPYYQQKLDDHPFDEFDDEEDLEQEGNERNNWNQFVVNHRAQNIKNYQEMQLQEAAVSLGDGSGFNRLHAFSYGIAKAGMGGVNQERVESIMKSAGNNKQFFLKQEGKMKENEEKIIQYKKKIHQYHSNEKLWQKTNNDVKIRLDVYRKERNLTRTWLHVDMDMFYAACEIRDRPDLVDKPVAVGDYSMIQTTNYVARKYGVRSAMPGFMGKKLCPSLVFIKSDKEKYKRVSENEFKVILRNFDPYLESIGLDEANLDITEYLQKNCLDMPEGRIFVAEKIRSMVKEQMKMTSSIGIACNKMLAKICSEINKPDGYSYLAFDSAKIEEFMRTKKAREIPGVGKVLEQTLIGLGINTIEDILLKASELYINFTENNFEFLVKAAMGISRCFHDQDQGQMAKRAISICQSFRVITRLDQFQSKLRAISDKLGDKCTELRVLGRTLSMEYKTEKFVHSQKSMTLSQYIGHKDDIFNYAIELLGAVWPLNEPVRTLALKLNNLRYRNEKDSSNSHLEILKESHLKYFLGKGKKNENVDGQEPPTQVNEGEQTQVNNITEEPSVTPVTFNFIHNSGPQSNTMTFKKKEKEERYKKLIGQRDILNFFHKPKSSKLENPQNENQQQVNPNSADNQEIQEQEAFQEQQLEEDGSFEHLFDCPPDSILPQKRLFGSNAIEDIEEEDPDAHYFEDYEDQNQQGEQYIEEEDIESDESEDALEQMLNEQCEMLIKEVENPESKKGAAKSKVIVPPNKKFKVL